MSINRSGAPWYCECAEEEEERAVVRKKCIVQIVDIGVVTYPAHSE